MSCASRRGSLNLATKIKTFAAKYYMCGKLLEFPLFVFKSDANATPASGDNKAQTIKRETH